MPKKSGLTNRDVVNHGAGKGDKTRVTDVQAYRANFDEIDWGPRRIPTFYHRLEKDGTPQRLRTLRDIEDEEFAWRMGL